MRNLLVWSKAMMLSFNNDCPYLELKMKAWNNYWLSKQVNKFISSKVDIKI